MTATLWRIVAAILLGLAGSLLAVALQAKLLLTVISGTAVLLIALLFVYLWERYPKLVGRRHSFAATAFVLCGSKILIVFHKRQKKWLPPGTHLRGVIAPHKEAHRAVQEETGFDARFSGIHDPEIHCDRFSTQVPQPFAAQLEDQLPYEGHDTHYDFFYLLEVDNEKASSGGELSHKWVTLDELKMMAERGDTYPDVHRLAVRVLQIGYRTQQRLLPFGARS